MMHADKLAEEVCEVESKYAAAVGRKAALEGEEQESDQHSGMYTHSQCKLFATTVSSQATSAAAATCLLKSLCQIGLHVSLSPSASSTHTCHQCPTIYVLHTLICTQAFAGMHVTFSKN